MSSQSSLYFFSFRLKWDFLDADVDVDDECKLGDRILPSMLESAKGGNVSDELFLLPVREVLRESILDILGNVLSSGKATFVTTGFEKKTFSFFPCFPVGVKAACRELP